MGAGRAFLAGRQRAWMMFRLVRAGADGAAGVVSAEGGGVSIHLPQLLSYPVARDDDGGVFGLLVIPGL